MCAVAGERVRERVFSQLRCGRGACPRTGPLSTSPPLVSAIVSQMHRGFDARIFRRAVRCYAGAVFVYPAAIGGGGSVPVVRPGGAFYATFFEAAPGPVPKLWQGSTSANGSSVNSLQLIAYNMSTPSISATRGKCSVLSCE